VVQKERTKLLMSHYFAIVRHKIGSNQNRLLISGCGVPAP